MLRCLQREIGGSFVQRNNFPYAPGCCKWLSLLIKPFEDLVLIIGLGRLTLPDVDLFDVLKIFLFFQVFSRAHCFGNVLTDKS